MTNIKKGKLNYDQSGRAYPDKPETKKTGNVYGRIKVSIIKL